MSVKITHLPAEVLDRIRKHDLSDGSCNAVLTIAKFDNYSSTSFLTVGRLGQETGGYLVNMPDMPDIDRAKTCYMLPQTSVPGSRGTSAAALAFYTALAGLHEMLPREIASNRSFWNSEADAIGWVRIKGVISSGPPSYLYLEDEGRVQIPPGLLDGQFLCVTRSRGASARSVQIDVITADGVATAAAATAVDGRYAFSFRMQGSADFPNLTFAPLEKSPLDILRQRTHVVPVPVKLKQREMRGGTRLYAFVPDLRTRFHLNLSRASKEAVLAAHVLRQAKLLLAQLELTSKAAIKRAAKKVDVSGNLVAASRSFLPEARARPLSKVS